jgi:hypothetical protein
MKVPANLPADRLILEYLSRVAAAGNRQLPKGRRMAFVSATRNRIWREIGPGGTADPDRVREVLARLGEPDDLVAAERARLDAETADRLERQARKKEAAEAAAAAAEAAAAAASGTAPAQYRPRSPRPRPARPAGSSRRPSGGQGDARTPEGRPGRRGMPKEGKPRRRLGGLLADWQDRLGTRPARPGGQAPPETVTGSPAGTAGQAPQSTAGQAPQGNAGQAPPGTGDQGPHGTAGQGPQGTGRQGTVGRGPGTAAGQAPENTTGHGPQGSGGHAPQGSGGPGSQGPAGPGSQGSDGPGSRDTGGQGTSRFAHWIPGFADAQAPGGTVAPATNGAGRQEAGGNPGARGSASLGQSANGATPTVGGAHQKGGTVPSGVGPPAEEETSALYRGTHALRRAAVTLGNGAVDLALDAADLARQHKLETAAVLLLGVGAFVFVFPFWLVLALLGGVVAIWSQIWNARDKWVGLTGPPVIALVGTIVSALIIGGQGHFVGSYLEAFRLYVGYYYRAGSLLCAIYLALQARRGPQRRLPPWKR